MYFFIVDQNCHNGKHLRWRAVRAAHYFINFATSSINRKRQMSRLESSHRTVFIRSSHLNVLTKSVLNTLMILDFLMG